HGEGPNQFFYEFCGKNQLNPTARPNGSTRSIHFMLATAPVIDQEERSRK
ncbi:uncharacterized protein FOBCDRAFT_142361, partial [Fusarium oxysporum Fo47]